MENFDSMIFYASWYENANEQGEEFRNKMLNQLLRYGLYGEEPDNSNDPVAKMMFKMAKPNIDSNIQKRIDGRKGGRPKKNHTKTTGLSNGNVNDNVNVNDNANVNVNQASFTASLEASQSEAIEAVDVSKLKGRGKR